MSRTAPESHDKQEAILAAALELFSKQTFYGTPVPLIAQHAGVAVGTIYRYFPNKEALGNALYQHWKARLKQALTEGLQDGMAPRDEFLQWWLRLWRFASAHPQQLLFLEMHVNADYLDEASRQLSADINTRVESFLARAQKRGAVKKLPPRVLVSLAYGAFIGLFRREHEEGRPLDERLALTTADCVWALLAA